MMQPLPMTRGHVLLISSVMLLFVVFAILSLVLWDANIVATDRYHTGLYGTLATLCSAISVSLGITCLVAFRVIIWPRWCFVQIRWQRIERWLDTPI